MATIYRVFNAKHQLVNSERIHRLFRFFSDNYSGIIGYKSKGVEYLSNTKIGDIISYDSTNKKITIKGDYISFIIRGMLFVMSHSESNPNEQESIFWGPQEFPYPKNDTHPQYNLLGIIVDVDAIEKSDINTITHHRIHTEDSIAYKNNMSNATNFGFYRIAGFDISKDSSNDLYKITKKNKSEDEIDWSSGYKFNAIKFNNLKTAEVSKGKSGYLIPVAAIDSSGNYVRLLDCRSKSSLEDFLSQAAIKTLKKDLDAKYVWQGNCTDNTQSKGKIGDLIISKNHISGAGNTNNLIVDTEHLNFNGLKNNKSNIYNQNKKNGKYYNKNWDDDSGLPLTLQKDGYVWPVDYLRVTFGGTGADNKADARKNLGISSGKTLPGDSNPKYENGDIFLKIIE